MPWAAGFPPVGHEWFVGHIAFQSAGLPVGSKPLLWALRAGPLSPDELVNTARCSRRSFSRYLNSLLEAGLVRKQPGLIELHGPDLATLLDDLAVALDAPDRREALKLRHAGQRLAFAQWRRAADREEWPDVGLSELPDPRSSSQHDSGRTSFR